MAVQQGGSRTPLQRLVASIQAFFSFAGRTARNIGTDRFVIVGSLAVIAASVVFGSYLWDWPDSAYSIIDGHLPPGRFNLAIPYLEQFLPNQIVNLISWALFLVVLVAAGKLMFERFSNRNTIYVRVLKDVIGIEDECVSFRWHSVAGGLQRQTQKIQSANDRFALTAVGEKIDASRQRISENVDSLANTVVNYSRQGFPFLDVANRVWPPQMLTIVRLDLSRTAGKRKLQLDCIFTGRGQEKFLPVEVDSNGAASENDLLANLAYMIMIARSRPPIPQKDDRVSLRHRIMMALSRLPMIKTHPTGNLGTGDWEAFKAHTEALSLWADLGIEKPECVKKIASKLEDSLRHDADYSLAHYNLGVLRYLPQATPETNKKARKHFQRAVKCANTSGDQPTEGLAWIGVSRCYSQDVHRFGVEEAVGDARNAADEADRLLPHDARTMYACAFAWHCTEDFEDIKKGRAIYEEIIRKYPGKFRPVYNNLGYILMVGGERLHGDGKREEAGVWWDQAESLMNEALEFKVQTERGISYTHANLGNLNRLRCEYQVAFDYYLKALIDDPTYTEGLNELARLYLDLDDMAQGFHYHELALCSIEEPTVDEDHQKLKLMREVNDILKKKCHQASEAVDLLYQETSAAAWPRETQTWLTRLAILLESDVDSSPK